MPDEPEGAGPPGEPEGDLTARLRRLEQRGAAPPRVPRRSTPWPVSDTPVPPPSPARPPVEPPAPPAPAAVAVPAPSTAPSTAPVAADEPAVPQPRRGDRLVVVLVVLAVLLLAAAAGLGAAALVEHQADPADRDAWISAALAAGIVLVVAAIVALLRRPRRP